MSKKLCKWTAMLFTVGAGVAVIFALSFPLVRHLLVEENEALAHAVGQRILPALLVNDGQQVEAMMQSLENFPGVQTAELVTTQGAAIASYARGGGQFDATTPGFALASALDDSNQLQVMAPIAFDGLNIAHLQMVVNLWPIYLRIMTWLGLLLIVPSVTYVVVQQLKIKVRFEITGSSGGAGSAGYELPFDLHAITTQAMAEADISLEYQPIKRLCDGELSGTEVVVCWRHPSGQTMHVSPANFVGLAKKVGICLPFDAWLLRESLEKAAVWQRQHGPLMLALDISEAQFKDPLFPRIVLDACDATLFPHHLLELEVSESVLSRQPMYGIKAVENFAAEGLNLTVQGFGLTENSSQIIQKLAIKKIKLDAKLIKNLLRDTHVFSLAHATVLNAVISDIQVTTEGIESHQQCEELHKMGCSLGQGAHLSQPLAVNDFELLLANRHRERVSSSAQVDAHMSLGFMA